MTRCFLAFEFDDASRAYLAERIVPFHERLAGREGWPVRLVRPENWHVTLLFFNGLEAAERETVWAEVERAAAAGTWRELAFAWLGLAVWPTTRRPNLICLEAELYPGVEEWPLPVAEEPFSKGELRQYRAYRPHATVMRFKRGGRRPVTREWAALNREAPAFDPARIRFDRVAFLLSTLTAEQPIYPRERSLLLDPAR